MNTPDDLLYADTHEWVRIDGDDAVIGITEFAQEQLGDITFVDLPSLGTILEAGQEMGSVESVKAASEIYSPVSGEVIEVNTDLDANPEIINESPYDGGWMIRVKLAASPSDLMSVEEYEELVQNDAH
jgi:glycine cleavage system H protein